jgi:hypothetical protein
LEGNRALTEKASIEHYVSKMALDAGAPEPLLQNAMEELQCSPPADYVAFLRLHNGGEGFVGENYLILWKIEELKPFNDEYEVAEYAPGLLVFGSSGGGEGYAFDTRQDAWTVVRVPFIGMDLQYAIEVGRGFSDFLRQLALS